MLTFHVTPNHLHRSSSSSPGLTWSAPSPAWWTASSLGQRKILYACFRCNLKSDIKVRRVDAGLNCLAVMSHDPATHSVPWTPPACSMALPIFVLSLSHRLLQPPLPPSLPPWQAQSSRATPAEHSAYHHGEASLQGTIMGLAQDFIGSNNINLLVPQGG